MQGQAAIACPGWGEDMPKGLDEMAVFAPPPGLSLDVEEALSCFLQHTGMISRKSQKRKSKSLSLDFRVLETIKKQLQRYSKRRVFVPTDSHKCH